LKAKGIAARVINAGLSGDTSAGGLARLDWALEPKPDFAIIELGANDGLRGLDPAQTNANLDAILSKLKAKGVPALLAGMYAPPNMGPDYGQAFNALYPALAEKHGVAFYPFFLDGVAANASLNQPDGIHPNAKGVDIIVARILPHVLRLIGKQ
jgi:acyl-CoA thioesterase-1